MSNLFVYGTLKNNSSHPMAAFLLENAQFLGEATMKGELYNISWYPGATYNPLSSFFVIGHAYHITKEAALFNKLDDYEGIGEAYPTPHEYKRIQVPIQLKGEIINAWVYNYQYNVQAIQQIKSGNWK